MTRKTEDLGIGIYKIILSAFPKERLLYVGQSVNLSKRIKTHRIDLKYNRHKNPYIQNVVNKHGLGKIKFVVICNCNLNELDALEQFYIDELKPECNIIRDIKNSHDRFDKPPTFNTISKDIPGLELNWKPKVWHRLVYGSGRA